MMTALAQAGRDQRRSLGGYKLDHQAELILHQRLEAGDDFEPGTEESVIDLNRQVADAQVLSPLGGGGVKDINPA